MLKLPNRQAIKPLRNLPVNPFQNAAYQPLWNALRIHSAPYLGPPTFEMLARRFSSLHPNPKLYLRKEKENYGRQYNEFVEWTEFYTSARKLTNKGEEAMEKVESFSFPKDNDPTLGEACDALSDALQKASEANVENDTPEVKWALDNLRRVYDEAAKSNTVPIRYLDVEPPPSPLSPLRNPRLERTILAHSWMKELIRGLDGQSLPSKLVVIGNPGIGKSVSLVGHLLFYLVAQGERVILQSDSFWGGIGFIFDDNGVRELDIHNVRMYRDHRPCCLLVSADGPQACPLPGFDFCNRTIVVTSPNIESKQNLKEWMKQVTATSFIAQPPSCQEVVYLLSEIQKYDSSIVYWIYREWTRDFRRSKIDCQNAISHLREGILFEWYKMKTKDIASLARKMLSGHEAPNALHQIPDSKSNLTIPSDLVTMQRIKKSTDRYSVTFMTKRIAMIVANVQEERDYVNNWQALKLHFDNPETRVAAGTLFQKMFLRKIRTQDLDTLPPCYQLGKAPVVNQLSPLSKDEETTMPWKGLRRQPTLECISVGRDIDGNLYSKKELQKSIEAVMEKDSLLVRFLVPLAQNWATWDAALFLRSEKEEKREVHIVFLQTTLQSDHKIYSKGLNQVRDIIPKGVSVHYHYILVLLTEDEPTSQIPKWRHVLLDSHGKQKDASWRRDNLRQYVMYVPMKELLKLSLKY